MTGVGVVTAAGPAGGAGAIAVAGVGAEASVEAGVGGKGEAPLVMERGMEMPTKVVVAMLEMAGVGNPGGIATAVRADLLC